MEAHLRNGFPEEFVPAMMPGTYPDFGMQSVPPPPGFSHPVMPSQAYRQFEPPKQVLPPQTGAYEYYESQGLQGTTVLEAPQEMRMVPPGFEAGYYNPSASPRPLAARVSRPPISAPGGMKLRARAPVDRQSTGLTAIPPEELISPDSSAHKKGILSFVNDPGDFYLTISEDSYGARLEQIQQGLAAFFADNSRRNEWVLRKVEAQVPCAARFAQDGGWYRAVVSPTSSGEPNFINVRFVDYGNEETIPREDVMHLPERFANVAPILAIRCGLKDAVPSGGAAMKWSRDSRAFLEGLLEDELICIFHGYDPVQAKYEVELINPCSDGEVPPDVLGALRKIHAAAPAIGAKKLPGGGYTQPVGCDGAGDSLDSAGALNIQRRFYESTTVDVPGMQSPLDIPAEIGEYLDVIVSYVEPRVNSKSEGNQDGQGGQAVFVNMIQEVPKLERMAYLMNERCPDAKPLLSSQITLGSLVAAKHNDGCWYRAVVLTKYGSGYWEVFFVDYGNREMVSDAMDLAPLPREFREYPPQAIRCTLKHIPDWVDREPLLRTPVTILLDEEGRNRKSFEVRMWYLDKRRGALDVGVELMTIMNKPRRRDGERGRK